jgi:hypothetical protein
MLVEFQKALADLTASPELCIEMRAQPSRLRERYQLTEKEWRQLTGIVQSKGMAANCMLYRANRLAPVALNIPETCDAIRDDLRRLISAYWDSEPTTDVHFLVEADRFCAFLEEQPDLSALAKEILAREHAIVAAKLEATRRMARPVEAANLPGS